MKVSVIGLGYIGLPTALLLAKAGHQVKGIDLDKAKIEKLSQGKLPFQEKGLEELYEQARKNFSVNSSFDGEADAVLVCVPTPMKDHKMEGKYVYSALEEIAGKLKEDTLVVIESTVTPGTTKNKAREILSRNNKKFYLAYCPERAIPGNTLHEMVHNDRVIGGIDEQSAEKARALYSTFVKGKIHTTDSTAAEIVKAAENTYRDVNIALANELAMIAEKENTNVYEVIELANKHPRVNIHQPGIGVGGHCLPIDPWFLVEAYPNAKLIPAARAVNDRMVEHAAEAVKKEGVSKAVIFGASYKPDVDDTRESPSKELEESLKNDGIRVQVYDPLVYPDRELEETVKGSQCIILATAHTTFRKIDWERLAPLLEEPKLLFDGRNFFSAPPKGFKYKGIGKG